MGKNRRQRGTHVDGSEESTESGDSKGSECKHFNSAININKLKKMVREKKTNNNVCPDCQKNGDSAVDNEGDNEYGFTNEPPKLWICLQCGHFACGRIQKSHAIQHYETARTNSHCVVIDTHQWTFWCYKCDEVVNNRSPEYKKKSHEIREILKKWKKANIPTQSKPYTPMCQNQISSSTDNEKTRILNDLPKIGGLTNLGNTCFFNAVLQCLAQTPYLVKVLDDLQVPGQKFILPGGSLKGTDDQDVELPPIEGTLENTGSFTLVLCKFLTEMQSSDGQVYRPTELFSSLRKKTMQCTDGGQHDSHELLRHLLELVRNEDVRRYQSVILKEVGYEKKKQECVDDDFKACVKFYGNQTNSKFLGPERVFRGELVSTLQCLECNHSSSRTEPFLDLSLPVLIDKSLPPLLKRKNNSFENSMDSMGNNVSNTPTKHELRKGHKSHERANRIRLKIRENRNASSPDSNRIAEDKKGNLNLESEESDADVEDNIENEDVSIPEIGESGYSSEKPSAVTSPVTSLAELRTSDQNINTAELNISPDENDISLCSNDYAQTKMENSPDLNNTPSLTDILMTDITENKKNGMTELTLSSSLIVHSDFTSPEGPTISPLSSPLTSKDSPTSPISSTVDGDENDKGVKLVLKLDTTEKNESSDKENALNKTTTDLDEKSANKDNKTTKKIPNGITDITSNMTKLNLSSPSESPTRYIVKEGECSIQLCLNQFIALELMSGNNKVGCTACSERENKGKKDGVKMVCTDSTKQYLISRVPAILILHLKRFQVQKFSFRKVAKHVSFPMLLDLAPVTKDYTKPRIYALYGVVEHSGTMYGGHYVAYVKSRAPLKPNDPRWSFLPGKDGFESKDTSSESNSDVESDEVSDAKTSEVEPPPGRWYHVSDSRVQEVDEKTVLNSEAYLLFYERIL